MVGEDLTGKAHLHFTVLNNINILLAYVKCLKARMSTMKHWPDKVYHHAPLAT